MSAKFPRGGGGGGGGGGGSRTFFSSKSKYFLSRILILNDNMEILHQEIKMHL